MLLVFLLFDLLNKVFMVHAFLLDNFCVLVMEFFSMFVQFISLFFMMRMSLYVLFFEFFLFLLDGLFF
jgi:hypothetical protein